MDIFQASLAALYKSYVLLTLTTAAAVYYVYCYISAKHPQDPPGPTGVPIFGNEFQIPSDKQWLKFHEWGQKYGDVVRITTLGQPIIILTSAKAAFELLDSKGSIYSSRPRAVMAGELVGWNRGLGYAPYGERFKEFRKLFHRILGPRPVQEFRPLQIKVTRRLLFDLLQNPEEFDFHARQSAGSTMVMIAYGYKAQTPNDPLIRIAEVAMKGFAKASEPGAFMVDRFPLLKHVPAWFPGAGFKQLAKKWRKDLERLYDVPFEFVSTELTAGRAIPSLTSKYLSERDPFTDKDAQFIKTAATSLCSAGVDNPPSAIVSFILAMTLHPEIQTKAQAEVDAIIGSGFQRLPNFEDRQHMPYVNALVKEVLRWNPSLPLGLPHEVSQDDVYRGYRIPTGATVWANIWSMLQDPSIFPDPSSFNPERYVECDDGYNACSEPNMRKLRLKILDKSADPSLLGFGFGRRICPGMHLANDGIFIAIASMLAVFDILKARDERGKEIIPEVDYVGFLSHPKPFRCEIRPRSKKASELIKRGLEEDEDSKQG